MKGYFKFSEFFVGCEPYEIDYVYNDEQLSYNLCQLFSSLNMLRECFGHPIIINSGYRSIDHNKRVGGVKNSWHTLCCAVDIRPQEPELMQMLVDDIYAYDLFPEVVIHKGYIHLSIRN